jgi:two-component system heavy metal sensor histidine kinase CusS
MSSKSSRRWSLAVRLTIWYAVASIALTVITIGILYWGLVGNLNRSEDLFLADKVHVLRAILQDRPDDIEGLREEVELESAARRYAQFYVRLLDGDGKKSLVTPGMDDLLQPASFTAATPTNVDPPHGARLPSQQNRSFWGLAAMAAVGRSGEKPWTIQVAMDRANDELLLAKYREWLWTVLGISVLFCPLVGYRIARRGIQPLQEITATAKHTGLATLDARIESAGYPVELAALADTFNAMLDRLQDSFRRLSQFSADLAHELRTPINNMRGEAEVALTKARSIDEYREALTSNLEETVRLSELIGSLLFLARAESPGMRLHTEAVQVLHELGTVRDYYEAAAAEAGVTLSLSSVDEVAVCVDRGLLRQAIGNLVANAIAHTAAGGTVTLGARIQEGELRIEVSDTGAGIPAEDLPRVFDRFYRVDKSRSTHSGVGLGLAIVKGIAGLHGGRTEIRSEVGKGTSVAVLFPMAQPFQAAEPSATFVSK